MLDIDSSRQRSAVSLAVADRLALADLVHLYAAGVDDRRFRDVAELFTETAELRLPEPPRELLPVRHWHGRDGVLSALSSLAEVARTQHEVVGEVYAAGPEADYALGRITAEFFRETDVQICVPHERPLRVHEVHLTALHCLCDGVDAQLLGDPDGDVLAVE